MDQPQFDTPAVAVNGATGDFSAPDLGEAQRHVLALTGGADTPLYWRLIDPTKKRQAIERYGTLAQHWPEISEANIDGYNVYFVVNEGGASARSITRIRAAWIDAEGRPLPEEWEWHQPPDLVVRRDALHWHAYWRVSDLALADFTSTQKRLIAYYSSDRNVHDLPRVMRLAGSLHHKHGTTSPGYRIATVRTGQVRTAAEVIAELPELAAEEHTPSAATGEPVTVDMLRDMLAHIDPSFADDQMTWLGIAKAIRHGQLPIEGEYDPIEMVDAWCSGTLWRERTGDAAFTVSTYTDREEVLHRLEDHARSTGPVTGLGTVVKLAIAGGYTGSIRITPPPSEAFAPFIANAGMLADAEKITNVMTQTLGTMAASMQAAAGRNKLIEERRPPDPNIRSDSDVVLAQFILSHLEYQFGHPLAAAEGRLHVYGGTHWQPVVEQEFMKNVIHKLDGEPYGDGRRLKMMEGKIRNVWSCLLREAHQPEFFARAPAGINCASGFIRFAADGTPTLEPHSPEHRQRHVLPGRWQPDGYPESDMAWEAPMLHKLLHGCFLGDADCAEKLALVEDILGAAASGCAARLPNRKAIVFHGPHAGNGKSAILDAARALLPPESVAAVPPGAFSDHRQRIRLRGMLLNACDELGTAQAIASDEFKAIVTSDPISGAVVYHEPIEFRCTALNIFATNTLPTFQNGMDRGVQRRLLVLPFNRVIPPEERVADIGQGIGAEEPDALLAVAVRGASRLIGRRGFTEPASSAGALRKWVLSSDPVLAWVKTRLRLEPEAWLPKAEAYADFETWAVREGYGRKHLPYVNQFAQRVLAAEEQIGEGQPRALKKQRSFRGCRLILPGGAA